MSEFELAVLQKGEIKFDVEEAKRRISERTSDFERLVVTEETIKDAKDIRATLNKERKAFDDERKSVKSEYEKPLKDFESKVKEVLAFYDKAIENIDSQLKAFDEERIKAKQEHLKQLYDENIGDYAEYIPFDKVKKPQWDNATYKDIDIIHDISAEKTKIMADLDVLQALDSEIYDKLIEKYKKSGNVLAEAIKANTDYIQAKQLTEKKAEEDAQAKIEAERKAREEAEQRAIEAEKKIEEVKEEPINPLPFDVETVRFVISGQENIDKVREFLTFSEIEFEEEVG